LCASAKRAAIICCALFLCAGSQPLYAKETKAPLTLLNFSELAQKVGRTVVNIRCAKVSQGSGGVLRHFGQDQPDEDDSMGDFFDRFFEENQPGDFAQRSFGSGFIIDSEGYIVTNNHVVEDADKIQVMLENHKEYDARIIGRDANTDLALIKIEPFEALTSADLGDSDLIKVGQWVVAIGSPFGLEHTVTAGIVSAKGRVIGSGPYDDYIQTDASINPGNSGGPLIDMQGQVVGINSAIIASGQGIGFAIPINLAKGIIRQLKENGEVTRGWLGVAIQNLSPQLAEYYGSQGVSGVLVTDVFSGDPADTAGIKPGDIILSINERKMQNNRDLTSTIADIMVGEKVKIEILRDGKPQTLTADIIKRNDERLVGSEKQNPSRDELGLQVSELNEEIVKRFNLSESEGVMVVRVEPGSKADQAELKAGDLIKEINRQPIQNVQAYATVIGQTKKGDRLEILLNRSHFGMIVIRLAK
jgi:serine protease Do